MAETDGEMLAEMGTDATRWAAQFARVVYERGHEMSRWDRQEAAEHGVDHRLTHLEARDMLATDPAPGGLLHGWLCNAIEAGRAAGWAAATAPAEPVDAPPYLPADPAGSDALPAAAAATPPADVAGSDLPADPAGSDRWAPDGFNGSDDPWPHLQPEPDAAGSYAERVLERLTIALERQAVALDALRASYVAANPVAPRSAPPARPGPPRVDPPRAPWQDEAQAPPEEYLR